MAVKFFMPRHFAMLFSVVLFWPMALSLFCLFSCCVAGFTVAIFAFYVTFVVLCWSRCFVMPCCYIVEVSSAVFLALAWKIVSLYCVVYFWRHCCWFLRRVFIVLCCVVCTISFHVTLLLFCGSLMVYYLVFLKMVSWLFYFWLCWLLLLVRGCFLFRVFLVCIVGAVYFSRRALLCCCHCFCFFVLRLA